MTACNCDLNEGCCRGHPMTDVDAVRAKLAEHSGKVIPVSSPMGTYFEYCVGCSEPRKNPSVDQRGLVGITDCPVQPYIAALEAVLALREAEIKEQMEKINRALRRHDEIIASIYAKFDREIQAKKDEVDD